MLFRRLFLSKYDSPVFEIKMLVCLLRNLLPTFPYVCFGSLIFKMHSKLQFKYVCPLQFKMPSESWLYIANFI